MDLIVLLQSVPVGEYATPWGLGVLLLFAIAWWRLLTWIDKDAVVVRLPREWVNFGAAGSFILAMVLFLLLPGFWIAFPVFIFLLLASLGTYLALRNHNVGMKDLIEELKHIKNPFKSGDKTDKFEAVAGSVVLASKDGRAIPEPAADSPDRSAYDVIQLMMTEPLRRGMERLELTPIEGAMLAQYWVDGVLYNGSQFNRQGAAAAITSLKAHGKDGHQRERKPQAGVLQAAVEGPPRGAGTDRRQRHRREPPADGRPKKRHTQRLDQLGFSPDQMQRLQAAIKEPGGVVLIAVPKGQGLTTLMYALIREHDAFLTHIHSVERDPEMDLEGVTQNKLSKTASPAEELQQIQWVGSQEPDTVLVPEVHNPKSVARTDRDRGRGKRIYIGLRSPSAIDAINDFRTMVGDDDLALKSLRMVVAGRVVAQALRCLQAALPAGPGNPPQAEPRSRQGPAVLPGPHPAHARPEGQPDHLQLLRGAAVQGPHRASLKCWMSAMKCVKPSRRMHR